MKSNTKKIVYSAVLVAMSIVLIYFVRFPIFPSAPYLEYDMGDVPIFVGALILGPWAGLLLTLAVSILQGVLVSAQSGWVGVLMHFIATGSFVIVAGLMAKGGSFKRVIPAFICGAVTMIIVMLPLNMVFTPATMTSGNMFSVLGDCTSELFSKCLFTLQGGVMGLLTVLCSCIFFCMAFVISLLFAMKKSDKKSRQFFTVKGIICGVVFGIIYAMLAIIIMNLLFGKVRFDISNMNFVSSLIIPVLIPFNAIKAFGNALLAYIVWFAVAKRLTVD